MLPVDVDSFDYRFNKTLNEDVRLKSDEYGKYDLDMVNGDVVNVTGNDSLHNACIIAILTRYHELQEIPTYKDFGCKVHDLIKGNKTKIMMFKIETSITETLNQIRRVKTVNYVNIVDNNADSYQVEFEVTNVNDQTVKGKVTL